MAWALPHCLLQVLHGNPLPLIKQWFWKVQLSVWYIVKTAAAQQDLLFHSMALQHGFVMYVVCPGEHKSMQEPGAALDGLGALLAEIEVMLSIAKSPQVR